jgi:Rod binding domain-containing protein
MPTPIDRAALPAEIRAADPGTRKLYSTALEFEQVLLRELASALVDSTQSQDDDASGGAAGIYRERLPDALAESLTAAGGVGLARELTRSLAR